VWLPPRRDWRARLAGSATATLVLSGLLAGAFFLRATWDLSENRRNSFPAADEAALRQIRSPLHITVFLAAEDPRLTDLDRSILSKLERILPSVQIDYAAQTRTGLFEGAVDHYGEVWYELDGRKIMSRSTTEAIVLENLYKLAGISPPSHAGETEFSGHPLAKSSAGAAWIYYGLWPLAIALLWWRQFRYS
jgi:hypothetical protein